VHQTAGCAPDWNAVIVHLRNPSRTVELRGGRTVAKLLNEFGLPRESVLIVRNGTLVPGDALLEDADEIEVRPVISGGAS
jgi:sulfur carrier protein